MAQKTTTEIQYQAIGIVSGSLEQLDDGNYQLQTFDLLFPVWVNKKLALWLSKHPDQMSGLWLVYPRQNGEVLHLSVQSHLQQPWEGWEPNVFKISGRIYQDKKAGKIRVTVRRNCSPPPGQEKHLLWRPFKFELLGHLPGRAGGEFWKFDCIRTGHALEIIDGERLAPRQKRPQPTPKPAA